MALWKCFMEISFIPHNKPRGGALLSPFCRFEALRQRKVKEWVGKWKNWALDPGVSDSKVSHYAGFLTLKQRMYLGCFTIFQVLFCIFFTSIHIVILWWKRYCFPYLQLRELTGSTVWFVQGIITLDWRLRFTIMSSFLCLSVVTAQRISNQIMYTHTHRHIFPVALFK